MKSIKLIDPIYIKINMTNNQTNYGDFIKNKS